MKAWWYLPADVQRLASLHGDTLAALELYVDDDGTMLGTPAATAIYVGESLFGHRCPLPDVLLAIALCAVKFATKPAEIERS